MINGKPFCILLLSALHLFPNIGTAQTSYEERYFKLVDYLLTFPYDLLGKTSFEISSLNVPPEGAPINKNYWSISIHRAQAEFYDSFAEISTGLAPIHLLFSTKHRDAFVIRYYSSLDIDFDRIKQHLESMGITFDRSGSTQIFQDRDRRGHFFIQLTMENKVAVLNIYAVDPESGKTKM